MTNETSERLIRLAAIKPRQKSVLSLTESTEGRRLSLSVAHGVILPIDRKKFSLERSLYSSRIFSTMYRLWFCRNGSQLLGMGLHYLLGVGQGFSSDTMVSDSALDSVMIEISAVENALEG